MKKLFKQINYRNIFIINGLLLFLLFIPLEITGVEDVLEKYNNYINIAKNYHDKKQDQEAIKYYQEAIKLIPNNIKGYDGLGQVYLEMNDFQEAINWFEKVVEIDPKNINIYEKLAVAYKNPIESLEWYKKAVKLNPKDSRGYIGVGRSYMSLRKYPQAIKYCKRAVELSPNNVRSYINLAWGYYYTGTYQKAIGWANKANRINLEFDHKEIANEIIGRSFIALGKYDKAEKILKSIVDKKNLENFGYWGCPFQALGGLYSHMAITDKKKKILENYMKAADIEKYTGFTQFDTAKKCYEYGDYVNAQIYIDRAFKCKDNFRNSLNLLIV